MGLIGSVSVLIGVPVFLLNEQVERARDDIDALAGDVGARFNVLDTRIDTRFNAFENRIDTKFNAFEDRIDTRFIAFENRIDARFDEQDAKFDARFAQQDARFDEQDAKFDELAKGQAEIDRKLTALIASLGKTDAVEASLAGRIPP